MRISEINRKTNETDISLKLNIDGKGKSEINSGCGFLDHMLTLFARHSGFDLDITCKGDTYVDYHHTAEDIAIVLGDVKAIDKADSEEVSTAYFLLSRMLGALEKKRRRHRRPEESRKVGYFHL